MNTADSVKFTPKSKYTIIKKIIIILDMITATSFQFIKILHLSKNKYIICCIFLRLFDSGRTEIMNYDLL